MTAAGVPLSLDSIREQLTTRRIGRYLVVHGEVDSTNRVATVLAENGAPHGTVVVSETQSQGRGRLNRTWISPPGVNLYFSILLHRVSTFPIIPWLSLFGGLAVVRAIEHISGLQGRVKWPNDVIVDRTHPPLKLAGVLAEATERAVVIGIGVNVNMAPDAFPPELRSIATSMLMETARPVDRGALLARVLWEAEQLYDSEHPVEEGMSAYRKACSTLGQAVQVTFISGNQLEGIAETIAGDGALCLRRPDGALLEIRAGDVVHLR
jgi:BirA family transcriptional regulator, biotin operon repressor / biotin---[acetyl-CoA-carboxylase] ligase